MRNNTYDNRKSGGSTEIDRPSSNVGVAISPNKSVKSISSQ